MVQCGWVDGGGRALLHCLSANTSWPQPTSCGPCFFLPTMIGMNNSCWQHFTSSIVPCSWFSFSPRGSLNSVSSGRCGSSLNPRLVQLRTAGGLIHLKAAFGWWEDDRWELIHRSSHLPTFGQIILGSVCRPLRKYQEILSFCSHQWSE